MARGKAAEIQPRIEARIDALVKEAEDQPEPNSPVSTARAASPREAADVPLDRLPARPDRPQAGEPRASRTGTPPGRAAHQARQRHRAGGLLPWLRERHRDRHGRARGLESRPDPDRRRPGPLAPGLLSPAVHPGRELGRLVVGCQPGLRLPPRRHPIRTSSSSTLRSPAPTSSRSTRYNGPSAQGGITLNGLVIDPAGGNNNGSVFPVGDSETITSPWKLIRDGDFDRLTVQVTPERVRYLVNGHLFHQEDDPSPTSPWLGLYTPPRSPDHLVQPDAQGKPDLPPRGPPQPRRPARRLDLELLWRDPAAEADDAGCRREWEFHLRPPDGQARHAGTIPAATAINPDDFDWSAKDGVIQGRRLATLEPGRPGAAPRTRATRSRIRAASITSGPSATGMSSRTSSSASPIRSWSTRRSTGWPSCSNPTASACTG